MRGLLRSMGYEPELDVRRLEGRWDPVHLATVHEREPAERLAAAMSANLLAGRLRKAGSDARRRD